MGSLLDTDDSTMLGDASARLFDCIDALSFALVTDGSADESADETAADHLQRFTQGLGSLAEAANDAALPGLIDVSALLADRISALAETDAARQAQARDLLAQFPLVLMDYVAAPADPQASEAILAFLQADDWRADMADEELDLLRMLLQPLPEETEALPHGDAIAGPGAAEMSTDENEFESMLDGGALDAEPVEALSVHRTAVLDEGDVVESDAQTLGQGLADQADHEHGTESIAESSMGSEADEIVLGETSEPSAPLAVLHGVAVLDDVDEVADASDEVAGPDPVGGLDEAEIGSATSQADQELAAALPAVESRGLEIQAVEAVPSVDGHLSDPTEHAGPEVSSTAAMPIDIQIDPAALQFVSTEMLALAIDALELNFAGLAEALDLATGEDHGQRHSGWEQLSDELDRMAGGAEAVGLAALGVSLLAARELISTWQAKSDAMLSTMGGALAELPAALRGYLSAPNDACEADVFVKLLRRLDVESQFRVEWADLARALVALEFAEPEPIEGEGRPVEATEDDVSLDPPGDINQELLEGLLTELPIQTGAFTDAVQRIASGHGRIADIDVAKRAAHTLKGAANTVGIKGIANLTHYLEDILIALAEHGVLPNLGLSQTLGYAADCLEVMSEALVGAGQAPEDTVTVLQDVLNWANRIDSQGIEVAAAEQSGMTDAFAAEAESAAPSVRAEPVAAHMLRVPTSLVDEQLRLVGESMTSTAQVQNRLQFAMAQLRAVGEQNEMLRQLVNELEDLVDLRGIDVPRPEAVDTGFDALEFDQYGELHTVARRLVEVTTDASEMTRGAQEHLGELRDLVSQQSRLHLASQEAVLRARMVPVASVVSRLHRAVRQAGRLLDKEVELALKGTDTLIDSNVLNDLVDALMHVLRNAVDHGIEPAGVRLAAGKDEAGHIEMAFKREGDVIIVSCRDDGQGLDIGQIRRTAQRRRLIGANDSLTDDQLARLILAAGFSTRDEATQVSGRGIGLDAVNSIVEDLKGSITLHNRPGEGLTIEIRLPTTLLSAQALLVRLAGTTLAVATRGIEEIHFMTLDQLRKVGSQLAYSHGDQLYDAVRLGDLLSLGRAEIAGEQEHALLMVRMSSGVSKAVLVEEIAESRSLVVKKLGPYVGRIGGIIGATILGDGSVAPVIDLPDLLRVDQRGAAVVERGRLVGGDEAGPRVSGVRTALVVDDSISARRVTAQLFKDAGFEVQTAIDGLDAVAILDRMIPDVIMTDLEMPRMNGLELTAHIRARAETSAVPVVMITSRSTEKHRQQAQAKGVDLYLTKPFNTDDLLGQVGAMIGR